jgi:putative SOS response-associated peptidase YedK
MRWGLVPWWATDIKVGFSSINARAETVDTTRAFRDAWKKGQRCLVVTDGLYEWKKPEKQPYAVAMADKSHMVMTGLCDEWTDKKTGERVKSCTIITCPANALVGTLHDRMPVILAEEDWAKWLGALMMHRGSSGKREATRRRPRAHNGLGRGQKALVDCSYSQFGASGDAGSWPFGDGPFGNRILAIEP